MSWKVKKYRPESIVMKAVIAGQGNEASPAVGQREKNLNGSIIPHLKFVKSANL